jgi:hypothetical protein
MPVRVLAVLLCAAVAAAAVAHAQTPPQQEPPQALFGRVILGDASTANGVKRLLRTGAGFVSPSPAFADLTGDGKSDAIATVENAGAAGVVAVYVLSADGSTDGQLHPVFATQALYQGRVRVNAPTLTVISAVYAPGDDVCCARRQLESDYSWDARARRFVRRAQRTVSAGSGTARTGA